MTIKELKEIIKEYSDDQFVHMRIWIERNTHVQATVTRHKAGVDGALLLIGGNND